MNISDKTEFNKILQSIYFINSKPPAPKEVQDIFFNCLVDYKFENVKIAFSKYMKNVDSGSFLPKPSDILKILEGSSKNKSLVAWDKVINSISSSYDVAFDDEIIHGVIRDMGGWVKFCGSINDFNREKIENGFRERYKNYLDFGLDDYPGVLIGTGGWARPEPVRFIGNREKAKSVMNKKPIPELSKNTAQVLNFVNR